MFADIGESRRWFYGKVKLLGTWTRFFSHTTDNVKQMSSLFLKGREQATVGGGGLVHPLLLLSVPKTGLQCFLKRLDERQLQM